MDKGEGLYVITGLGNPGVAYEKTRHNAGILVLDAFAKKHSLAFKPNASFLGNIAQGRFDEKRLLLLFPTTFMNVSGEAVRRCIEYYHVPLDHLMVICDDVALPIGRMKIRSRGSTGGHNGLKSIEANLRTIHYNRLRIGVGAGEQRELKEHVLGRFSQEEWGELEKVVQKAVDALELWLVAGIAAAMQSVNRSLEKDEGSNARNQKGETNEQTKDTSL